MCARCGCVGLILSRHATRRDTCPYSPTVLDIPWFVRSTLLNQAFGTAFPVGGPSGQGSTTGKRDSGVRGVVGVLHSFPVGRPFIVWQKSRTVLSVSKPVAAYVASDWVGIKIGCDSVACAYICSFVVSCKLARGNSCFLDGSVVLEHTDPSDAPSAISSAPPRLMDMACRYF